MQAVLSSIKVIFALPADEKALVKTAYIFAMSCVFLMGVPGAVLASLSAVLIARQKIVTGSQMAAIA